MRRADGTVFAAGSPVPLGTLLFFSTTLLISGLPSCHFVREGEKLHLVRSHSFRHHYVLCNVLFASLKKCFCLAREKKIRKPDLEVEEGNFFFLRLNVSLSCKDMFSMLVHCWGNLMKDVIESTIISHKQWNSCKHLQLVTLTVTLFHSIFLL